MPVNRRATSFFHPVSSQLHQKKLKRFSSKFQSTPFLLSVPPTQKHHSLPIQYSSAQTLHLPAQFSPPYAYEYAEKTLVMSPSRDDDEIDKEQGGIMDGANMDAAPIVQSREEYEQETKELVKYICDLDSGLGCLLEKVKQDMFHVKDVTTFLKKRAAIEEEYGRAISKLSQQMAESFEKTHPRAGTYGEAWVGMLKVHEQLGDGRVRFGGEIAEVADDLGLLYKDTEKARKQLKSTGLKFEQTLQDTELTLEKAKQSYEKKSEDWEMSILMKNGDMGSRRGRGMFKQSKTPAQLEKAEEDARMKAAVANENYKSQLVVTNDRRQEYFNTHLPKILTQLKEAGDECNANLRYQLARYSYIFEQAITTDGYTLDNDDGQGLRSLAEKMDKDADMKLWVKSHGGKAGRAQKGDIPYKEYRMSHTSIAPSSPSSLIPRPIFGIDLAIQMVRDGDEVPAILTACTKAIEGFGIGTNGIYRVSGTTAMIQNLRSQLDKGVANVDLEAPEIVSDIHNVSSVLKLWFRELPDPLFLRSAYPDFINAARIDDPRHRVITLHDNVNKLPDPNYATLKYLMCHLDKIQSNQRVNKMGVQNLAIVWGPTLMGGSDGDMSKVLDMEAQVRCVETILENYQVIFEPDE